MGNSITARLVPPPSETVGSLPFDEAVAPVAPSASNAHGRALAERLGYDMDLLDQAPGAAVNGFDGAGHVFALTEAKAWECVADLGSGMGLDSFLAAMKVGLFGRVVGIEDDEDRCAAAQRLRDRHGFDNVSFRTRSLWDTGLRGEDFDLVICNGSLSRTDDAARIVSEAGRLLKPGGRLAVCACLGDPAVEQRLRAAIATTGLRPADATLFTWGLSLLARKP